MTNIRIARDGDAETLPDIERSAGQLFHEIQELAWIADEDDLTVQRHRELIAMGTSWVAVDHDDRPIAFLSAEIQNNELHIWELSVRRGRQRLGIGRSLLEKAIKGARTRGLLAVTLTTFRDVNWNESLYTKVGFRTLRDDEMDERLAELIRQEAERGLPKSGRCAMRLALR
jgi:GNAT superfamily N-acetyltransferase